VVLVQPPAHGRQRRRAGPQRLVQALGAHRDQRVPGGQRLGFGEAGSLIARDLVAAGAVVALIEGGTIAFAGFKNPLSSFAISAISGVDTGTIWSQIFP